MFIILQLVQASRVSPARVPRHQRLQVTAGDVITPRSRRAHTYTAAAIIYYIHSYIMLAFYLKI